MPHPLGPPAPGHWPSPPALVSFPRPQAIFAPAPACRFPHGGNRQSGTQDDTHSDDQMANGTGPPLRQSSSSGSPVPLDPGPSSLRVLPSRLWGPSQCFLPWLTSSDYLLDPGCLPAPACALQTATHDLPKSALVICYLAWHPWRDEGSHKVPISFFTRNTNPSPHPSFKKSDPTQKPSQTIRPPGLSLRYH